ncbi:MAG: flagellar brake protein [Candidatus Accumulibacter sp.]|jgi:c-di-GMP-binding flagellar brake protein YcgR|nr:flagellar brake protein [Accumulibacter sp.]
MVDNDTQEFPPSFNPRFEIELTNGDYNRYLLYSEAEILAVLRLITQKGTLITVHFDHGRFFFLTSMIGVMPESAEFVLDVGSNEEMNARALRADKLICTTLVDKVKIQFGLERLRRAEYQGNIAFVGAMPDKLLRLQRREFFRLSTPVVDPIRLCMMLEPEGQTTSVSLLDISGGGVGLMLPVDLAALLEKGRMLENCKITLPGEGLLIIALCVRNMFNVTSRGGSRYVRVGCEFIDLSAARLSAVQRYIIRVERERKARLSGLS